MPTQEFRRVKIALAKALYGKRKQKQITQLGLAQKMGSSQSRISKMEKSEASVDGLIWGLIILGASRREIGRWIATS